MLHVGLGVSRPRVARPSRGGLSFRGSQPDPCEECGWVRQAPSRWLRRSVEAEPDSSLFSPLPSPGQQQLTVQSVSGNNLTISGLSPTQIQLQMEQALSGELQPGEKRRRMACTCPNCKDGEKR